jgi:thermostable 8-oxoguanine DNA glycosylase
MDRRFNEKERLIDFETCHDRTEAELQSFLMFAICAAGKNARTADMALSRFLRDSTGTPFDYLARLDRQGALDSEIRRARIGQYGRISRAFRCLSSGGLDLRNCSTDDLESVPGVGPKTSRYFILHTRRDAQVAALDTHVLGHLREMGYDVPASTPTGKRYRVLEDIFLELARKSGMTPAEYDYQIWSSRSGSAK